MHSVPAARAVTQEATEIARRMIADMTGPNGQFVPIDQQHQYNQQHQTRDLEMQQQLQQQLTSRDPRYEPFVPSSGTSDAHIPIAPPPEIMVQSPSMNEPERHPAFRAR